MTGPAIPSVIPAWTVGNESQRSQPTSGQQFSGYSVNQRPPAGQHNWLFGIFSDWINYLQYAVVNAAVPVSNVGHNILVGTTLQQQLDETDAFLSSLGLEKSTMTVTSNPLVYSLSTLPLNGSTPIVFIDGEAQIPGTDFSFSVTSGVGYATFVTAPSAGQTVWCMILAANNPGSGGTSVNGGFVVYGSVMSPQVIVASVGLESTSDQRALFMISSGSAGAINVSANPQISAGTKSGQEIRLVCVDATNTVEFTSGNGLFLNGPCILGLNQSIDLWWNGSVWVESDRSN